MNTRLREDASQKIDLDLTSVPYQYKSGYGSWQTGYNNRDDPDLWEGTYRTMVDTITPNFRTRSNSGEVIINPMSSTVLERRYAVGSFRYHNGLTGGSAYEAEYPTYWFHWRGLLSGLYTKNGHVPHGIDIDRLKTLAGTDCLADINSSKFEGLVFLAELREMLSFARNPVKAFRNFLKIWKKKYHRFSHFKRNKGVSFLEWIAQDWLAWRYAIRPVIGDLNNALDALDAMKKKRPERLTARGFASDTSVVTSSDSSTNGDFTRTTTTKTTVEVRCGALYTAEWDDLWGVSPLKLPLAAWETIPFSFMADWVVNVGSYIGSLTPRLGVKILGQWTTVTIIRRTTVRLDRVSIASPRYIVSHNPSYEYITQTDIDRQEGIKSGLTFEPDVINLVEDFKAKRLLDLIAIASGFIRSFLEAEKRRTFEAKRRRRKAK